MDDIGRLDDIERLDDSGPLQTRSRYHVPVKFRRKLTPCEAPPPATRTARSSLELALCATSPRRIDGEESLSCMMELTQHRAVARQKLVELALDAAIVAS